MHGIGGGERYTKEAFRSVSVSGGLCVGYSLDQVFPSDIPISKRLLEHFVPFDANGIVSSQKISFRELLIRAADYDLIWVHQYLSNPMIFDLLTNAASDQIMILTSLGHEAEL